MRPLKLTITHEQDAALQQGRQSAELDFAERCLYVLLNAKKGYSTYQIADLLLRDVRIVRHWLQHFDAQGIDALHSPKGLGGRTREFRDRVKAAMDGMLEQEPSAYDLRATYWTRALIAQACQQKLGCSVSVDTVSNVLKETGWRYKRPRKSVPEHAPDSAEKKRNKSTCCKMNC